MAVINQQKAVISALACKKCGAPMYPDMKECGFICLYCSSFRPFAVTDEDFAPAVKFRHQPVKIVEGMLKLGHVALEEKGALDPPPMEERLKRLLPIELKLMARDRKAYEALCDESYYELNCPYCSNHLTVSVTESIFTCPYCNQKFGEQNTVSSGKYDERLVLGRKLNLYSKCLPFKVTRTMAQVRLEGILEKFAKGTRMVSQKLTAAYIPVQLTDFRWKIKAECERGSFWYYQECLDWAWPRSIIYDIFLLDELAPWDYGELAPLKPAYLEGKVQLLAAENLGDWQAKIPNWILQRTAPRRLRNAFDVKEIKLRWVSRDLRKHNYGLILLPIYAIEYVSEKEETVRAMVNGQTGKAALQIATSEGEFTRIIEPEKGCPMSPETTMLSPPIPVRFVKSPFLHERLRFSEALNSK